MGFDTKFRDESNPHDDTPHEERGRRPGNVVFKANRERVYCTCGVVISQPARNVRLPVGTDPGFGIPERVVQDGCPICKVGGSREYSPPPIRAFIMDQLERRPLDATNYRLTAHQLRVRLVRVWTNAVAVTAESIRRYVVPPPGGFVDELIEKSIATSVRARKRVTNEPYSTKHHAGMPLHLRVIRAINLLRGR